LSYHIANKGLLDKKWIALKMSYPFDFIGAAGRGRTVMAARAGGF